MIGTDLRPLAGKLVGSPDWTSTLVLIHGIEGDPVQTWKRRGAVVAWYDRLASAIPGLAVVSLGFGAQLRRQQQEKFIEHHSRECFGWIIERRLLDRPLTICCYSLGGIVLKRMLADHTHDSRFALRRLNLNAIVFLGVPHRGSSWARAPRRWLLGGRASSALKDLEPESRFLEDVHHRFAAIWSRLSGHVQMLSVQETLGPRPSELAPLLRPLRLIPPATRFPLVVSPTSSTMGGVNERVMKVQASHLSLPYFGYPDAPLIETEIEALIRGTSSPSGDDSRLFDRLT